MNGPRDEASERERALEVLRQFSPATLAWLKLDGLRRVQQEQRGIRITKPKAEGEQ